MATVSPSTAGRIEVVEPGEQITAPAAADISAGTFVRQNSSGDLIPSIATTGSNVAGARLALRTVKSGEPLTAMKSGIVGGLTLTDQAFNAPLYVSDTGTLADTAGTSSALVGRVVPGTANQVADAHDKLVRIDCPN